MKVAVCNVLAWSWNSFNRDLCSIHRGFECLGVESYHVRPPSIDGTSIPGLIEVPDEVLWSSAFWKLHLFDVVIINTWGNPQYAPLIRAIKQSAAVLVARMDSDGYPSPWCGVRYYGFKTYYLFRSKDSALGSFARAFLKTCLYSIPQVYDTSMLKSLECADYIGLESEGALRSVSRFAERYKQGLLNQKFRLIRHPVVPEMETRRIDTLGTKENVIVSIGSWHLPVKNVGLLIATLSRVLVKQPTWSAVIAGPGSNVAEKLVSKLLPRVASRIQIVGSRDHEAILTLLSRSKIYLFASTSESGPIAAQEALCLGCTVVGPPDIPSTEDLCQPCFGTRPKNRAPQQMAAAVESEIFAWENQLRDPSVIAAKARDIYSAQEVCKKILSYLS